MADEALAPDEGNQDEPSVVEPQDQPAQDAPDGEGGEQPKESSEFEIVRQGKDGSQPDKDVWEQRIRKRVNRANKKVHTAEDATSQAQNDLRLKEEENKLLRLALEQKTETVKPPDPADFEAGVSDPRYSEALSQFNKPAIDAAVKASVDALTAQQPAPLDPGIERSQEEHYKRAAKLGAKDFEKTEDKAIDILGNDNVNHIIQIFDQSEMLLYYLGKNPGEAERIKTLIDTNPGKAVARLGRLEGELNVKPRANDESAPNPDDDLRGGAPSSSTKRGPPGATYS